MFEASATPIGIARCTWGGWGFPGAPFCAAQAPELLRAVDEGLHASEPALDDVIRETLCSQTHAVCRGRAKS